MHLSKLLSGIGATAVALTMSASIASAASGSMMNMDRYGGKAYLGQPDLPATVAFVMAGGGPTKFSFATALTSMVGGDMVEDEVGKLDKQYGKAEVAQWLKTWDFAVPDVLKQVKADGIKLPAPANLKGHALAVALVKAGSTHNSTFWTGDMLDHTVSNKIHNQTMDDIDKKYGQKADADYHKITNQAMYDLAQALGAKSIKLAPFH